MLQAMIKHLTLPLSFALLLPPLVGSAQQTSLPARLPHPKAADVAVQGYVYEPVAAKPDQAGARHLQVPQNFQVNVFASRHSFVS